MTKPPIIMSAMAAASLARVVDAKPVQKDLSVAAMLGKLHEVAATLLHEMSLTDAPTAKKLAMAKDMAKLLPLLAVAERKVMKGIGNKAVEDMTDKELRRALKVVKGSGRH